MVAKTIDTKEADGYWNAVREAAGVLDHGGLVVFPTETVYGVAARADRPDAMRRLRKTKQRSDDKPFTLHIPSRTVALSYVGQPGTVAERLMKKGWPGPLTLVLSMDDPTSAPAAAELDRDTIDALYHDKTVGLRCPDQPFATDLLRETGGPVVAASANRAGRKAARTAAQAAKELNGDVDLILDGGRARYSKPSTIVRVDGDGYELIRAGVFDKRMIDDMLAVSVLLVCTGNTCRSPMARGIASKLLAEKVGCTPDELPGRRIHVLAAGTFAGSGVPPSANAVEVMRRRGIDIAAHESQPLTVELIRQADRIYVMTAGHRETVLETDPSAADRTATLLPDGDVTDPIGGDVAIYERCADAIESALKERLTEVDL